MHHIVVHVMSETKSRRERLQDIDTDLAREIVKDSQDTHRFTIFAERDQDHVTTIEYRCTGDAAVVRFCSPAAEYAFHGDADDVWRTFESEIQAELDTRPAVGRTVVEHKFGVRPITAPAVDYPDNVSISSVEDDQ